MKPKVLVAFNTLTLIVVLIVNYLPNTGLFDKSVGEISNQYTTLFVPAGYAFAIWGLIYLMLLAYVAFQWYAIYRASADQQYIRQASIWFIVTNIANSAWVILWVNEYLGASVVVMFVILFALIKLTLALRLEVWDAPVRIIALVWWPIAIYLGWIMVASIANTAAFLVSRGYQGAPLTPFIWTLLMILVATGLYLFLIFTRNLREAAMVGVWALAAIAYRQWEQVPIIAYVAIAAAIVLFVAAGYHGAKNVETSPLKKWQRNEV